MPLEAVTYISDLVATNPVNATDQVAQGDDHIRNIKTALLNSFPNITGAVTPTQADLNSLAAFAALSVLGRAANTVGTPAPIAAGADDRLLRRTASTLNFGQLTAGMFPNAVIPDAALSANLPLLNAANAFSAAQTVNSGATAQALVLNATATSTYLAFQSSGANKGFIGYGAAIGGSADAASISLRSEGNIQLLAGGSSTKLTLATDGSITTPNANASEFGFKGVPLNIKTGNYTCVLADASKNIQYEGAGGHTLTLPAGASVGYPEGTVITFIHWGSGALTIAGPSDGVLYLAGTGLLTTGNRTLAVGGIATAILVDTPTTAPRWIISGPGLT